MQSLLSVLGLLYPLAHTTVPYAIRNSQGFPISFLSLLLGYLLWYSSSEGKAPERLGSGQTVACIAAREAPSWKVTKVAVGKGCPVVHLFQNACSE